MQTKEVNVTPTMAYKWLEGNVLNRALRQGVVERYARDMKAGKWRLTHEAIAFAPDGSVIDGQHRLWAVIESETPTRFLVATDVDPDSRSVINSGLIRTDVDHMRFGFGLKVNAAEVAVLKRLLTPGGSRIQWKPTTDELHAHYIKHAEAVKFAIAAFPRVVRGVTVAPTMAVVARAFYTADRDKLRHFAERLTEGRFDAPDDEPILMLRNYLLERAAKTAGKQGDVIYAKTERALWAYLHGERPSTLYAASSEMFPLPDEPKSTRRVTVSGTKKQKTVTVVARRKAS